MLKVLKVAHTDKRGKSHILTINKTVQEIENSELKWVAKSLKELKDTQGNKLCPCVWHSGSCHSPGDNNNPSLCYIDPTPSFGIWLTDYIVYDTCHIQETKDNKNKTREINEMYKLIEELPSQSELCESLNDAYKKKFLDRNELLNKLKSLEKIINESINVNDSSYISLKEMVKINESRYNECVKNLTDTYNSIKNRSISLESFIEKYTIDERLKLKKSKEDVQNWYNAHSKSDKSNLMDIYYQVNSQIKNLNIDLSKSYEIPYAHIYRLYLNLHKIEKTLFKYKVYKNYTPKNLDEDLNWCKINLDLYSEFVGNTDPMKIVTKVEREKQISQEEEKKFNTHKNVEKITKRNIVVMNDDGTFEEVNIDYKIYTGNVIVEEDGWRNTNTTFRSKPVVDDSKWNNLR